MSTKPENLFDVRTVARHLTESTVSPAEFDAMLASLPDDAEEVDESVVLMILHPRARRTVVDGADEEEG